LLIRGEEQKVLQRLLQIKVEARHDDVDDIAEEDEGVGASVVPDKTGSEEVATDVTSGGNQDEIICEKCGKHLASKYSLRAHIKNVHTRRQCYKTFYGRNLRIFIIS
jgi:hypothetical protein